LNLPLFERQSLSSRMSRGLGRKLLARATMLNSEAERLCCWPTTFESSTALDEEVKTLVQTLQRKHLHALKSILVFYSFPQE
jgi:hypothetical protein